MTLFALLEKTERVASNAGMFVACCAIFGLIVLIVVEVALRSFFGSSTLIADEFGGYALVCIAFLPLARSFRSGVHITIDGLVAMTPSPIRKLCQAVQLLCLLVLALIIVYEGTKFAANSYLLDARAPSVAGTPLWIAQAVITLAALFLILAVVVSPFSAPSGQDR